MEHHLQGSHVMLLRLMGNRADQKCLTAGSYWCAGRFSHDLILKRHFEFIFIRSVCVESRSLPRGLNRWYNSFWSFFSLILIYWTHVSTCVFENHRFSLVTTETMTKEWLSDSIWWQSNFQPTPWWQLDHTKALKHWGKCICDERVLFSL